LAPDATGQRGATSCPRDRAIRAGLPCERPFRRLAVRSSAILTFAAVKERAEEAHPRSGFLGVTRVIGGNLHSHRALCRHLRLARPAVLDFRVRTRKVDAVRPPPHVAEQKANRAIFGPVRGR